MYNLLMANSTIEVLKAAEGWFLEQVSTISKERNPWVVLSVTKVGIPLTTFSQYIGVVIYNSFNNNLKEATEQFTPDESTIGP